MVLEKPQSAVVETVLTDCYNAGRMAVLEALIDYMEIKNNDKEVAYCAPFYQWYIEHQNSYRMRFKIGDKYYDDDYS